MTDNQKIYDSVEFSNFANRADLLQEEELLLEKYFIKEKKTVEAGTAGGRILFELKKKGYNSLFGYDFVKGFIDEAEKRNIDKSISFSVQDASDLNYDDNMFDQAIYLQQIICNIEDPDKRLKGIKEAYRILNKNGVLLISFCNFDSKKNEFVSRMFITYLKILRTITRKKINIQSLPWLKHAGKPNWNAFFDREPYNYWFKAEEVQKILISVGFSIVAIGFPRNILEGTMKSDYNDLNDSDFDGHIYFVCKKQ